MRLINPVPCPIDDYVSPLSYSFARSGCGQCFTRICDNLRVIITYEMSFDKCTIKISSAQLCKTDPWPHLRQILRTYLLWQSVLQALRHHGSYEFSALSRLRERGPWSKRSNLHISGYPIWSRVLESRRRHLFERLFFRNTPAYRRTKAWRWAFRLEAALYRL